MTALNNRENALVFWTVTGRPVDPDDDDSKTGRWSGGTASLRSRTPASCTAARVRIGSSAHGVPGA